jgi:hypothetical protein
MVYDLGSANGTRVNGRRVESGRLCPGDELAIGPIRFRIESRPPASPRPGAAADSRCCAGSQGAEPV